MVWTLCGRDATGRETERFPLAKGRVHLALHKSALVVVPGAPQDASATLGILDVDCWGAKLQAVHDPISILPGGVSYNADNEPHPAPYELQPVQADRAEVMLIREGDSVRSHKSAASLTLVRDVPHVQVNSSVNANEEVPETEPQPDGIIPSSGAETELDEGDNRTETLPLRPDTPVDSMTTRSVVVQETPTADRVAALINVPDMKVATPQTTPPGAIVTPGTNLEAFSTAPTKQIGVDEPPTSSDSKDEAAGPTTTPMTASSKALRQPSVINPSKRASADADVEPDSPSKRNAKRSKLAAEVQTDSIRPTVAARKYSSKGRSSASDTHIEEEPSPRSSRSSQQSTAAEKEYAGDPPRVALSNSSVTPTSSFAKFLKKNGGTLVESVSDGCNILCVKDGPLAKTMKLLQSLALGIPVVSETWLISSAKARRFLPLSSFIPSIPDQETLLGFSLRAVWAKSQKDLLQGHRVYFTPGLKAVYKDFAEVEEVCRAAGVEKVLAKKPKLAEVDDGGNIIVLALEDEDDELVRGGARCYTKDLLTCSILRGALDLKSEEFRIRVQPSDEQARARSKNGEEDGPQERHTMKETPGRRRGRPRKS